MQHHHHLHFRPHSSSSCKPVRCLTGDSARLITASAASSVKLWDVASGKDLFTYKSQEPCRAVAFSAYSTDQFMGQPSAIHLVNIADDLSQQKADVIKSLSGPKGRITRVAWTDLNRTLVSAGEDGFVRRWDVEVCPSEGPGHMSFLIHASLHGT